MSDYARHEETTRANVEAKRRANTREVLEDAVADALDAGISPVDVRESVEYAIQMSSEAS